MVKVQFRKVRAAAHGRDIGLHIQRYCNAGRAARPACVAFMIKACGRPSAAQDPGNNRQGWCLRRLCVNSGNWMTVYVADVADAMLLARATGCRVHGHQTL